MKITINGETEELADSKVTITELLKLKEVKMPDMVSVEHNGEMLERDQFDSVTIADGDSVEFLYFMGGGTGQ